MRSIRLLLCCIGNCSYFFPDLWLMLKKAFLFKRRHYFRSFCEMFIPVFIALIIIPVYFLADTDYYYNTNYALSAREVYPLGDMFAHVKSIGYHVAVIGKDADVENFINKMNAFYPGFKFDKNVLTAEEKQRIGDDIDLLEIPKFSEIAKKFKDEDTFKNYVKGRDYVNQDAIMFAITINSFENGNYDYLLRYNNSDPTPGFKSENSIVDAWANIVEWDEIDKFISMDYKPKSPNPSEEDVLKEKARFTKTQGFLTLQNSIDKMIIEHEVEDSNKYSDEELYEVFETKTYLVKSDINEKIQKTIKALNETHHDSLMSEIRKLTKEYNYDPQVTRITLFPQFVQEYNVVFSNLAMSIGTLFVLIYMYTSSWMVYDVVYEKEKKLREGMCMMGLNEAALNCSWLIVYFIETTVSAVLVTIVLAFLIEHSNVFFIFLIFFFYGITLISFVYLISTFFSRAKTAVIGSVILLFLFFFVAIFFKTTDMSYSVKMGLSIFFPVAFDLGLGVFCNLESNGIGLTVSTINKSWKDQTYSGAILMLFVDTVIYLILAWYCDRVVPREYGTHYKWYFLFTKSYWCGTNHDDIRVADSTSDQDLRVPDNLDANGNKKEHFEDLEPKLKDLYNQGKCVDVKDLFKTFNTPDGKKIAVNNLNMQMYEGQIFVLLGHNGAGKSTTISMLSGLFSPTSGNATMYGYDMNTQMSEIRKIMGICPQHDVLFDELTVRQHLVLFAHLKRIPEDKINIAVEKVINEIGLREKIDYPSAQLSGGQKRKLSVGIALIGNSKIVFLDEPTSGMDPYSRRSTWSILQSNKEGRIIILTTHFMDEADLLADRIGIMHEGQMICCGRPHFLKQEYGIGYTLTVVKKSLEDGPKIEKLVGEMVPDAELLTDVGKEISFRLPFASGQQFPALLKEIDNNKDNHGIDSYGMSATTMEEVFLNSAKIADRENILEVQQSRKSGISKIQLSRKYKEFNRAEAAKRNMFFTHYGACLKKRMLYVKRDLKGVICQILIPIVVMCLGFLLMTMDFSSEAGIFEINTHLYNKEVQNTTEKYKTVFPYDNVKNPSSVQFLKYLEKNDVVPNPIDASKYYSDEGCLLEESLQSLSEDKRIEECRKVNAKKDFAVPIYGLYQYLRETANDEEATKYLAFAEVPDLITNRYVSYIFVNSSSGHGSAIGINLVNQALLRHYSGNANAKLLISGSNMPFSFSDESNVENMKGFAIPIVNVLALAFVASYYVSFIVKEKEVGVKHQQLISGVSLPAYWIATFTWDMITYLLPCIFGVVFMYIFDMKQFKNHIGGVIVLFILYGLAVAQSTYFLSYIFKVHSSAQNTVLFLNIMIVLFIDVKFFLGQIKETCRLAEVLDWFFFIFFPGYTFGIGMYRIGIWDSLSMMDGMCDMLHNIPVDIQPYPESGGEFEFDKIGKSVLFLVLQFVIYGFLAIMTDYILSYPKLKQKIFPDKDLPKRCFTPDEDVKKEADRIREGMIHESGKKETIQVKGLRKVWNGKKIAVEDLNFGLIPGTCFGFLGINGAGKTTTLEMLSGDVVPTKGTASINDYDILTDQIEVRRLLGYCPQFDALLDLLTVKEHLYLYAKIKGVPDDIIDDVINEKIDQMDLGKFVNKTAGSLSGGNKRKLSVAIALIGNPPLVFLDEPSTGMDPAARRHMWDIIADITIKRCDTTIILTTHSMEEAEALCTLVGIMVGGRLRCLGSLQHLKNRFGQGFMLEVKLKENKEEDVKEKVKQITVVEGELLYEEDIEEACKVLGKVDRFDLINEIDSGWSVYSEINKHNHVSKSFFADWWLLEDRVKNLTDILKQMFNEIELLERHDTYLRFKIDTENLKLGELFDLIEGKKEELSIKEYSFAQTSLEQIFNSFASQQEEEKGEIRGLKKQGSTSASLRRLTTGLKKKSRKSILTFEVEHI